jgi:hypothetical protein
MSGGYAVASTLKVPRRNRGIIGANQIKRARYTVEEKKPMKLTFKQRIRNCNYNQYKIGRNKLPKSRSHFFF